VVRSFKSLPVYGWEFLGRPEADNFATWSDRLSVDWRSEPGGLSHTLDLFQEGYDRHLDLRIWFDGLRVFAAEHEEIALDDFAAGGVRWWGRAPRKRSANGGTRNRVSRRERPNPIRGTVSSMLPSAKRPSRPAVLSSRPVRENGQGAPADRSRVRLLVGLCRKWWSGRADLRIRQRSLQLGVEVHGFLQKLAVYKVTAFEVTNPTAVCQATLQEANICA
jgi:hypothetical protein